MHLSFDSIYGTLFIFNLTICLTSHHRVQGRQQLNYQIATDRFKKWPDITLQQNHERIELWMQYEPPL